MVAGDQVTIVFLIVEGKGKDTVEILKEIDSLFLVKCKNNFTIRLCLKFILRFKRISANGRVSGLLVSLNSS